MIDAYKSFWKNIFNFSGTSSRKYYWWPIIINWILGVILIMIIQATTGTSLTDPLDAVHYFIRTNQYTSFNSTINFSLNSTSSLIAFLIWIASLSIKFRRLHDSDHSAWWILIQIIPFIGNIWFFILMVLPSRPNRWN